MILPGGFRGAAFGTTVEGDARTDETARRSMASELGIADEWASVTQVHGSEVVEAVSSGVLGEADAIFTSVSGLPAAVGYADCVPVIVEGLDVVAEGKQLIELFFDRDPLGRRELQRKR